MKLSRRSLRPHLDEWVKEGLIDSTQAERIRMLYPAEGMNYWMLAFAIVGSVLCVGGISLIIASNWSEIPDLAKIAGLIILLAAASVTAIETQTRGWSRAWWECGYLAATIFPLLGLVLISQIFHIEGHPANLFLIWTVAILPVPFLSRSVSSYVVLLAALMWAIGTRVDLWWDFGGEREGQIYCAIYAAFGAACALLSQLWLKAGEPILCRVGEFWGLMTFFLAIYILGFQVEAWFLTWGLLFLASLALIYRGYAAERVHQVNLGFVMAGLVILSVFIRLVGTMFDTGIIFLVGGIGLILFVVLINMLRRRVLAKIA